MEANEQKKLVVAKPVASRPSCSIPISSEVFRDPVQSSSVSHHVVPIKPKTTRLKPSIFSQANQELVFHDVDEESEPTSTVICKSSSKPVSKTTSTDQQLVNLGCITANHVLPLADHISSKALTQEVNQHGRPKRKKSRQVEKINESSKTVTRNVEQNQKTAASTSSSCVDRSSYDGYNWRKYGQKQVKGSEFPRSYYKCTHPNCPVKKKVERSFEGQIAEIVYRGEHNHTKPPPPKKHVLQASQSDETDKNSVNETNQNIVTGDVSKELEFDVHNEFDCAALKKYYSEKMPIMPDSIDDDCYGFINLNCDEIIGEMGSNFDYQTTNKRKHEEERADEGGGSSLPSLQVPRIVVQNLTDAEMLEDGFRWRKYGQKVVGVNPYPRSYYRCTNEKCNARKHVERTADDARAFVATYEGKHNHEKQC